MATGEPGLRTRPPFPSRTLLSSSFGSTTLVGPLRLCPLPRPEMTPRDNRTPPVGPPFLLLSSPPPHCSLGLVVESKLLPETEKSIAYELFLPLKQLKLLVDSQASPIYESLGRKLRRLKCVNRETGLALPSPPSSLPPPPPPGLYTEISNTIPPSFLEQLCDLILRNIETVIEPKSEEEKKKAATATATAATTGELGVEEESEEGDAEDADEMRRNYRVRIKLKSGER
jgi:hypothetical protein